jgi:hypothetical protein
LVFLKKYGAGIDKGPADWPLQFQSNCKY